MNLNRLIVKPVITEKSLGVTAINQYTFIVNKKSNKYQIKQAVEHQFKVHVTAVATQTLKSTAKRTGKRRLPSRTNSTKKAIVTIKSGESIPAFEA